MAADTITRRHCSQCDEWTMVPCDHCAHSARICCLKVTGSNWANQLLLKRSDNPEDCDGTNGVKNTCGSFSLVNNCIDFRVSWALNGGVSCTRVTVTIRGIKVAGDVNTSIGTWIEHTFSGGLDWYTSPISWTQGGVTYTVQACDPEDGGIDYRANDSVMLKYVAVDTDPPATNVGFGTGNRLCGFSTVCGLETEVGSQSTCGVDPGFGFAFSCVTVEWTYSILTDEITVMRGKYNTSTNAFFPLGSPLFVTVYGADGIWVGASESHTIWYQSTVDGQAAVGRVNGCADSWVPNLCYGESDPPCEPCPCIRDGTTGVPVVIIFCMVETPLWSTTVGLTYNGTNWQYLSGGIPERTVTIQCMGGDPVTYMISVNDGVTEYIWSMTGKWLCDPAKSYLEMIDRDSTEPTTGDASILLFTNNTGARP